MKTKIGCLAIVASVMGMAAEAAAMGENYEGAAGNRGLSPIITASASVAAATPKLKYDAVYSMCGYKHSADQVPVLIERDNGVNPMRPIYSYFFGRGVTFEQIKAAPRHVTVLKSPAHGKLVPYTEAATSFIYHANPGYLGSDQMIFEVETMGKKFKVIQTVIVDNSGDLDYPTPKAVETGDKVCPSEKGSSLDIIELPTDGFASDEELAKLHRINRGQTTFSAARNGS